MITFEITEPTILNLLSGCNDKTMHDLFDMLPENGMPEEGAITFIKTLNQLLEMELVATSRSSTGQVYWNITEDGRKNLNDYLNI